MCLCMVRRLWLPVVGVGSNPGHPVGTYFYAIHFLDVLISVK